MMEIDVSDDCANRCWKNFPHYNSYAEAAGDVEAQATATEALQVVTGGYFRCAGLRRVNIGVTGCERNHHCQADVAAPVIEQVVATSADGSVTATIPISVTSPPDLAPGMNVDPIQ